MISWMQRHRKYLVVTIWISTIAFIGAGFVGWGQYSYGQKATSVAKVGDIEISGRELQNSYSNLYNQYNQIFQGNFDQAQAKSFGLEKMALKQLIDQALVLNLAKEYGLLVSDAELLEAVSSQKAFHKNGAFDKETYQQVLKQNSLNIKDYESDVRKSLLIQKTLALFPQEVYPIEEQTLAALNNIADKVSYKVLTTDMITLNPDDAALKSFWEARKQNYLNPPRYELAVVTQEAISEPADDTALKEYYTANRSTFTDAEGKILEFDAAKAAVQQAMDDKATHKAALKQYIAFKKEQLEAGSAVETLKVTEANNPFGPEIFTEITQLSEAEPFLKPRKIGSVYKTVKLVAATAAEPQSFEEAKEAVRADYVVEEKTAKLTELAKSSMETFSGETTPFITRTYAQNLGSLNAAETKQFVNGLFAQQTKRGYITLDNTKVVLFHILEQKLLKTPQTDLKQGTMRLKSSLLDRGLLKMLQNKYPAEIYIEGI